MHTDEAVHAEKFKDLLEEGKYEYDPNEYHGPTLNYFTLPIAWLSSAHTLAQCNETTLRLVPVLFGVGVVLLFLCLKDALGLFGAIFAAVLSAISATLVYYNRYYIQETQLIFFTFLALMAGWRYTRSPKIGWAILTGVSLGLMHATKETCVIAWGALVLALVIVWFWYQKSQADAKPIRSFLNQKHLAICVGSWLFISVLFFTSFFRNPQGVLDSIRTYSSYFTKAGAPGIHDHLWYYYLQILTYVRYFDGPRWSEGLIVILAAVGLLRILFGKPTAGNIWFMRIVGLYTLSMILVYSWIPYKTPWCMMGFLHGMILLAGWAAAWLLQLSPKLVAKVIVGFLLTIATVHLGWQAYRAGFVYAADTCNPYVYAHTSEDLLQLVDRVQALSESHPEKQNMPVEVICPGADYWPLP